MDIYQSIQILLESLPDTLETIKPTPPIPSNVASVIDHTLLTPSATPTDIQQCCKEAVDLKAATVCVNSSSIGVAVESLHGTSVKPICTISFPFGAGNLEGKVKEAEVAKASGAKEIDMVRVG
jgi:deoxyribose-phosphate aldolase